MKTFFLLVVYVDTYINVNLEKNKDRVGGRFAENKLRVDRERERARNCVDKDNEKMHKRERERDGSSFVRFYVSITMRGEIC